ncbi:MAG TPA: acyltransferase [Crinalium sp.]|jgi:peptidoglycan/LPS O-acetylase OafA/YrhL
MSKDQSFQIFRGLAIVAVVAIHAISLASSSSGNFELQSALIFRQFINFAVPVFLFISGYFSVKLFNNRNDYFRFLESRLTRLLTPYLIWSLAGIILLRNWHEVKPIEAAILLLTGQSVGPYYYIVVLLQFTLITPILIKSLTNRFLSAFIISLSPISLLILYGINLFSDGLSFPWYALPCTIWIMFYYWGIYARVKLDDAWFYKKLPVFIFCLLLCLLLSVIESQYLHERWNDSEFAASQIKVSSFAASFCFINVLMGLRKIGIESHFIARLGDFSFGIYLVHMFLLAPSISLIDRIPVISHFHLAIIAIATPLTIALCIALSLLSRKVLGEKMSTQLLGL